MAVHFLSLPLSVPLHALHPIPLWFRVCLRLASTPSVAHWMTRLSADALNSRVERRRGSPIPLLLHILTPPLASSQGILCGGWGAVPICPPTVPARLLVRDSASARVALPCNVPALASRLMESLRVLNVAYGNNPCLRGVLNDSDTGSDVLTELALTTNWP